MTEGSESRECCPSFAAEFFRESCSRVEFPARGGNEEPLDSGVDTLSVAFSLPSLQTDHVSAKSFALVPRSLQRARADTAALAQAGIPKVIRGEGNCERELRPMPLETQ
ncbi:hypothetical protein MRX96_027379 [Rhipicephalus microplus]